MPTKCSVFKDAYFILFCFSVFPTVNCKNQTIQFVAYLEDMFWLFWPGLSCMLIDSAADPVNFFRIWIRIRILGFGFLSPDPDTSDPQKTGSFLDMFLIISKINNFCMALSYQI